MSMALVITYIYIYISKEMKTRKNKWSWDDEKEKRQKKKLTDDIKDCRIRLQDQTRERNEILEREGGWWEWMVIILGEREECGRREDEW